MKFEESHIRGAWIVDLERREDERGFFARAYCRREFEEVGLDFDIKQMNTSLSKTEGTLRGLHFQHPPHGEAKFIRCIAGAVLDVIVDLRPESPTFLDSAAVELTASNRRGLFLPKRCAHGFMTLSADTEVLYLVDEYYAPAQEDGLRWDDDRLSIEWGREPTAISPRDQAWPDLRGREADLRTSMMIGRGDR